MLEQPDLARGYLRKNLSLAWPLALNALLMQSMLIIDTLLVSPLGEIPLAALGIATTIIAFFLGIQFAIGNGTQLMVGRIAGAGDAHGLRRTLSDGVLISVIAALLFFVAITIFSDNLIALLTRDEQLRTQAGIYLAITKYLLIANAISQTFTVFLNGQGDTKTAFKVYLLEVPFNTVMSYLLIFGVQSLSFEGLGVAGAAVGSLAAVLLRLVLLLRHIRKLPVIDGFRVKEQFAARQVRAQFREILPIATNFVVLSLGITIYQLLFSQLEIYSYVAVTLVFPWLRIATQIIVAWAQANSISITQAIGQSKHTHLKPIVESCIWLGLAMACGVSLALFGFSHLVPVIYPKVEQQTLAAMASIAPLYILLPLVRTYNTIAGNSLRAMGKSVQVLQVHFFAQWLVVLPLCALFVLYFELPLFWAFALLPAEEIIKAIPFHRMLSHSINQVPAHESA
ncbi:MAG: MATE family efflux transporter [Gammaproteobacteria bacterium]|nr:MATE family efflux transporter [Gammaproteobacteria bacterium]NNL49414.1 MATE family efflux transporter [Woeseiaceae bacterium]